MARDDENREFVVRPGGKRFEVFLGASYIVVTVFLVLADPSAYTCLVVAPAPFPWPGPTQSRVLYEVLRMHRPLKEWLKDHNKTMEWLRDRLLEEMDTYVLTKDPCLQKPMKSRGGIPYGRQACSLLISYGPVLAESLHIDLASPLYRGLLLLTPTPPIHVFPVQNDLKMNVLGGGGLHRSDVSMAHVIHLPRNES